MSGQTEMDIYLKKDYMQYTGSFKERGARCTINFMLFRFIFYYFIQKRYTLMMLPEAQKKVGVIAASAGNHALALAYHGGLLGN